MTNEEARKHALDFFGGDAEELWRQTAYYESADPARRRVIARAIRELYGFEMPTLAVLAEDPRFNCWMN